MEVFELCISLTNVTIGNATTSIGDGAFYNCYNLQNFFLPKGVTNIGVAAFYGCQRLVSLTIPASVTYMGTSAFRSCTSLQSMYFLGEPPATDSGVFDLDHVVAFYLPSASGWGTQFAFIPAVLWNPIIQFNDGGFGVQGNEFGFNITGATNIQVTVQASGSLTGTNWESLTTITLADGAGRFSELLQTNTLERFYRLNGPPTSGGPIAFD